MSEPKFVGFQILDPKKWTEFHKNELTPKPFGDYDVDIKIQACGVCARYVFSNPAIEVTIARMLTPNLVIYTLSLEVGVNSTSHFA